DPPLTDQQDRQKQKGEVGPAIGSRRHHHAGKDIGGRTRAAIQGVDQGKEERKKKVDLTPFGVEEPDRRTQKKKPAHNDDRPPAIRRIIPLKIEITKDGENHQVLERSPYQP